MILLKDSDNAPPLAWNNLGSFAMLTGARARAWQCKVGSTTSWYLPACARDGMED